MRCLLAAALLACAACVPARSGPPVVTPGSPFTLADGRFASAEMTMRVPDGWRVVTNEAGAPRTLTLVAPDECSVIIVSVAPLTTPGRPPGCGDAALRAEMRAVTAGGRRYAVALSAPAAGWDAFAAEAERAVASLE